MIPLIPIKLHRFPNWLRLKIGYCHIWCVCFHHLSFSTYFHVTKHHTMLVCACYIYIFPAIFPRQSKENKGVPHGPGDLCSIRRFDLRKRSQDVGMASGELMQPIPAARGLFPHLCWFTTQQTCEGEKWVLDTMSNKPLGNMTIAYWLVALTILKHISQWEGLSHILWKIKNVWNHQPAYYSIL